MNLPEEAKRKIKEEEEYREKIRSRSKPFWSKPIGGKGKGCLILVGLLILISAIGSASDDSTNPLTNDQPSNQALVETYSEADKAGFAKQYCSERKTSSRLFPLLDLTETSIGVKEGNYKKGSQLALEDCRRNVDALIGADYEKDIGNIVKVKLWVGMKKMELVASVGSPDDVNKGVYGGFTSEQWIYYKDSLFSAYYIYVDNDVVTSWQDF